MFNAPKTNTKPPNTKNPPKKIINVSALIMPKTNIIRPDSNTIPTKPAPTITIKLRFDIGLVFGFIFKSCLLMMKIPISQNGIVNRSNP